MQRRDQIDATRSKHFAWSFVRPGDTEGIAELLRAAEAHEAPLLAEAPLAPLAPAASEAQLERSREKARSACRALATAIAEAWAVVDEEAASRSAKRSRAWTPTRRRRSASCGSSCATARR
jgi:hypothetical protein